MSTQEERQINTEYAVSLLEQLKLFYEQQLLTDIVLIVEGTEFPCHKMVLATCSSYFRYVFESLLLFEEKKDVLKATVSQMFTMFNV